MNTIAPIVLLSLFTASAVSAQPRPLPNDLEGHVNFAYADVLHVNPVYETIRYREPRRECYDEPVLYRERGEQTHGGAVLGAIVGGALGSQVGSGSGRRAATVAGAVAGGAIGHGTDRRDAAPDRVYEGMESRCRMVEVEREERRIAGYDVEYQYKDEVYLSHLPYDPGSQLRVRVAVTPAD
jgi:uncharacterized protein YcfJ